MTSLLNPDRRNREGRQSKLDLEICIPTYNRAAVLKAALRSSIDALDELPACHGGILVIDNASSDQTEEVVTGFDDNRIRYLRYQDNVSMYANHNRCVEQTEGRYLMFLHSDDQIPPGYLRRVSERLNDQEQTCSTTPIDLVIDGGLIDPDPKLGCCSDSSPAVAIERAHLAAASIMLTGGGSPSGSLYRTTTLRNVGGFITDAINADADLLVQYLLNHRNVVSMRHDRSVWETTPYSATANPAYARHAMAALSIFRRAFRTADRGQLESALQKTLQSLPPATACIGLFHLAAAGYPCLAMRSCLAATTRKLLVQPRFYAQSLPAMLSPSLSRAAFWRISHVRRKYLRS